MSIKYIRYINKGYPTYSFEVNGTCYTITRESVGNLRNFTVTLACENEPIQDLDLKALGCTSYVNLWTRLSRLRKRHIKKGKLNEPSNN